MTSQKTANKNMIVSQSNQLVEARYSLTLYEQRLVLMMISMVEPEDEDFKDYVIKISDFKSLIELKTNNLYPKIKMLLRGLRNKDILIPKQGRDYLITGWLSDAEYLDNEGVVLLSFSKKLKPYLLALKENFTSHRLGTAIQFKGVYTIRIYTLLKQYEKIGYRVFSIEEFKEFLGIDFDKYILFADLKRRTITQAQKEFSQKNKDGAYISDLNFDLETKKTGRKISHLKFIIKKQKTAPIKQLQIDLPEEQNPYQNTPEYKTMLLIAISEPHALGFMEQYGVEYIAEKLQVLKERQQIEDIKSPSGFFIKALKEDWKSEKIQKQQKEQERRKKEEEKRRQEQLEQRKHDLVYEFGKFARKEFLASLSESEESQFIAELKEKHAGDFFTLGEINKKGLSSMIIAGEIIRKIPDYEVKKEAYIKANL